MSGRRDTARLLVTPETADAVEEALYPMLVQAGRKITKTDLADAIVRVGLKHKEEVAGLLREDAREESPKEPGDE